MPGRKSWFPRRTSKPPKSSKPFRSAPSRLDDGPGPDQEAHDGQPPVHKRRRLTLPNPAPLSVKLAAERFGSEEERALANPIALIPRHPHNHKIQAVPRAGLLNASTCSDSTDLPLGAEALPQNLETRIRAGGKRTKGASPLPDWLAEAFQPLSQPSASNKRRSSYHDSATDPDFQPSKKKQKQKHRDIGQVVDRFRWRPSTQNFHHPSPKRPIPIERFSSPPVEDERSSAFPIVGAVEARDLQKAQASVPPIRQPPLRTETNLRNEGTSSPFGADPVGFGTGSGTAKASGRGRRFSSPSVSEHHQPLGVRRSEGSGSTARRPFWSASARTPSWSEVPQAQSLYASKLAVAAQASIPSPSTRLALFGPHASQSPYIPRPSTSQPARFGRPATIHPSHLSRPIHTAFTPSITPSLPRRSSKPALRNFNSPSKARRFVFNNSDPPPPPLPHLQPYRHQAAQPDNLANGAGLNPGEGAYVPNEDGAARMRAAAEDEFRMMTEGWDSAGANQGVDAMAEDPLVAVEDNDRVQV